MKTLLIILIILIILFLLGWFFCRRKKCCPKENPSCKTEEPAVVRNAEPDPVKKNYLSFVKSAAEGFSDMHGYRRIVAINAETPNADNDRICNIGISVGDGAGIESSALRINPEVQLDDVPDGLTADDILNAPTFPQLWPELSALFEDSLVLAHNTSHDLNILKKVLKAYGLSAPGFDYACTYRTSRKFHPEFENHKLGTICEIYGIPLDTRDAVSHSDACLEIFRHLTSEGQPFFEEAKEFTPD